MFQSEKKKVKINILFKEKNTLDLKTIIKKFLEN